MKKKQYDTNPLITGFKMTPKQIKARAKAKLIKKARRKK